MASDGVSTIIDTQAPTVPSDVAVSSMTSNTVTLTWTASTDNVGVTGYDIYKGSTLAGSVTGSTLTYTVTGLTANTSYSFTVKAKDAAGKVSVASSAISAIIDTQAPSAPSGLKGSVVTANSLTLAWTAPTDNVGGYYKVFNGSTLLGSTGLTSYVVPI